VANNYVEILVPNAAQAALPLNNTAPTNAKGYSIFGFGR
jgi:hypothetical protein